MIGVLSEVEVCRPPQLLLDDERLLQKLEPPGQELVLDLKEISFAHVHLEWLVDDGEAGVVLDVLPAPVAVDNYAYKLASIRSIVHSSMINTATYLLGARSRVSCAKSRTLCPGPRRALRSARACATQ